MFIEYLGGKKVDAYMHFAVTQLIPLFNKLV